MDNDLLPKAEWHFLTIFSTFCSGKARIIKTDFTRNSKYSIDCVSSSWDLAQLITNPKHCSKNITVSLSCNRAVQLWLRIIMSSVYTASLIPIFPRRAMDYLSSFVNLLGAGP